jgi:hypothetical protein
MSRPGPLPIFLKIYDLHQANSSLHRVGAGFYHTGVEVNGYEYSFSAAGVVRTIPTLPDFGELRERMPMGEFQEGMAGINRIISELRNMRFQPGAYDAIHLNCNHFSEAFCMNSVNTHIPVWCNRMAEIGSNFSARTAAAAPGGEGMAAPGVVKAPELRNLNATASIGDGAKTAGAAAAPYYSIFDFFGWGSGTSSSSGGSAANPRSVDTPTTSAPQPMAAARPAKSDPSKKKELTEKQKELLARMKKT